MQDGATANTANYFANILNEVLEDILKKTVASRSPDSSL
jgi:hypothetical protein